MSHLKDDPTITRTRDGITPAQMPQLAPHFPSTLVRETAHLRAFARRIVADGDADDLVQDTLVTALSQPSPPRSLRPWLRRVLRNQQRATARRDIRRRAREDTSTIGEPISSVDDRIAQSELIRALQTILCELDEPYRRTLEQRFFAERTAADIARMEGCPAATVRWRMQEGLRQVRRKLDERFKGRSQWLGSMVMLSDLSWSKPAVAHAPGQITMTHSSFFTIAATITLAAGGGMMASRSEAAPSPASSSTAITAQLDASPASPSVQPSTTASFHDRIERQRQREALQRLDAERASATPNKDCKDCDEAKAPSPPPPQVDPNAPNPEVVAKKLGIDPRGSTDAKVTIVECIDFDCPYCEKSRATIDRLVADHEDTIAVYQIHQPLPMHKTAKTAAKAALAASRQGNYWEMADLLFDNSEARSTSDIAKLAMSLGLDMDKFRHDLADSTLDEILAEHQHACAGNGSSGTPSLFINGDLHGGARGYDYYKAVIKKKLAEANE